MEVTILKLDHFGNGLGKIEDKVIFVKRALPSEVVEVLLEENKKNYQSGVIKVIKKESDKRIESICPYYNECGGCDFLHAKKEVEISFKKAKGEELITNDLTFFDTCEYHYRNKATFHIKNQKIGFYQEKSNKIIDISYCYLLDKRINDILSMLRDYLEENNDRLEEAIVKVGNEEMLIVKGDVSSKFIARFKEIDTLVINNKVIKGKGYITKDLLGYKFKISPQSFFQVNDQGLNAIYEILQRNLQGHYQKALDLYSGTSVMGILISRFCNQVISVESNEEATKDALINIQNNNIKNITVINDKVENVIDQLVDVDLIIVDPPRAGLDKKTIDYIQKISPTKLIYISCNMITLRRDLNLLKNNYDLDNFNLVNMFPKTYHVESVCCLLKKDDNNVGSEKCLDI